MMEKDDAVSTVIALMLVLGIIVTLIAIYSATYLPGLKQQSEIEHSREVADAFARFGSDIEHAVLQQKSARFSEPFSLGGGDVLLSPVRSSGSVTIEKEPLVNVTVTNQTGSVMTRNASLVNVSYVPSFTTWEPQGYLWEYGFVAVTKDDVAVPQSSDYNNISEARADSDEFLCFFVYLTPNGGGDIEITVVNLLPKKDGWFMTGSGRATLGLNATVSESYLENVETIVFENCTVGDGDKVSEMMGKHLEKLCDSTNSDTYVYVPGTLSSPPRHTLTFSTTPPKVTLRTVNVEVGVW